MQLENLLPKDGEVLFFPGCFTVEESDQYLNRLVSEVAWKQEPIRMFGKEILQPRLTAWYGDAGTYAYSGITMRSNAWTKILLAIKERVEPLAGTIFTNALLNQYRDGKDSVGWHRDNEKELGPLPVIGSVSFGATRTFWLRHREDKTLKRSIKLPPGSLLVMRGKTQQFWEHCIPKENRPVDVRINITFRVIMRGV